NDAYERNREQDAVCRRVQPRSLVTMKRRHVRPGIVRPHRADPDVEPHLVPDRVGDERVEGNDDGLAGTKRDALGAPSNPSKLIGTAPVSACMTRALSGRDDATEL